MDYGCGVRCFQGPQAAPELEALASALQSSAASAVAKLRRAKGCLSRSTGGKLVIQRAVEVHCKGHKEDLRVYVCCDLKKKVFLYRRLGLRRAPKAWDGSLEPAVQCTHYGHITPVESKQEWEHYETVFPRICEAVACIMKLITSHLDDCVVLLGMDFICDLNLKPFLLEINQTPRLCYEDPRVQAWTEAMAMDFLTLIIFEPKASSSWLAL